MTLRRALQINSAILAALSRAHGIPESTSFIIRTGEAQGQYTIGEALDLADAALEPEASEAAA